MKQNWETKIDTQKYSQLISDKEAKGSSLLTSYMVVVTTMLLSVFTSSAF